MHKNKKNIAFFHLLNDFSGSPKVLADVINHFKENNTVDLYTCHTSNNGFLSNIQDINYHYFWYKWYANKFVRLLVFLLSQLQLFGVLVGKYLFTSKKETIFYINTVLPFGAALAGKLLGVKVVYHVHETSITPKLLKWFLFAVIKITAKEVIYVSKFLEKKEGIGNVSSRVIYNTLDKQFLHNVFVNKEVRNNEGTILMLSSLKVYKGIFDFIDLARTLPHLKFELVLNAQAKEIEERFQDIMVPKNVTIFSKQENVHPFYSRAKVVLNLSHTDKWEETFGLTALEAMSYGLPVIVPPVGGIAEVVQDGVDGKHIDVTHKEKLISSIEEMYQNTPLYRKMSKNALLRSAYFNSSRFKASLDALLLNL